MFNVKFVNVIELALYNVDHGVRWTLFSNNQIYLYDSWLLEWRNDDSGNFTETFLRNQSVYQWYLRYNRCVCLLNQIP